MDNIKGKDKMKTFAFLTKDSFRVEVKAYNAKSGYNKLKSIPHISRKLTKSYIQYDSQGLASLHSWKTLSN
jgi:hypothetical protein